MQIPPPHLPVLAKAGNAGSEQAPDLLSETLRGVHTDPVFNTGECAQGKYDHMLKLNVGRI